MKSQPRRLTAVALLILVLSISVSFSSILGGMLQNIFVPIIFNRWPPPGKLLISELLYNPAGKEPDAEWVEFYNPDIRDIDLSKHKFGDEETIGEAEGMLQFPPGARISPGEVIVVAASANAFSQIYGSPPDYEMRESDPMVPNMIKYTAWAGGIVEFNNSGDEVVVLDEKDEIVDTLAYGNSTHFFNPTVSKAADGQSLERSPVYIDSDSANDWVTQASPNPWIVDKSTPTPSLPIETLTPTPGEAVVLLLSEVLYDPSGNEPDNEWIEIFNPSSFKVGLIGYKLGDEESKGGNEGMLVFPGDSQIHAGGVILIANQGVSFFNVYGFNPDFEISDSDPNIPDMIPYRDWGGSSLSLRNDGDELLILDAQDNLMDSLSWDDSAWAFDPPVPRVDQGHSLERQPGQQDTDSAADWFDQPNPTPGLVDTTLNTPTPSATLTPTTNPSITLTPSPTGLPTPEDGQLLVSEVLYDPIGSEPAAEWVEIFNAGGNSIDLTGYKVGDEETQGQGEGMYQFPIGTYLDAGEVFIIANEASQFEIGYGFKPQFELVESDVDVPNLVKYTDWASGSIALSNTGDDFLILDVNDRLVDSISWGTSTWAFDPSVPDVTEGHSLLRYPATQDSDSADDWIDQEIPDPGQVNVGDNIIARFLIWLQVLEF